MADVEPKPPSFFGRFPERGVWTQLGLSRAQFLAIIAVSVAAFVFIDGPLWRHVEANHFRRIVASYALIPMLFAGCQLMRNGIDVWRLVAGSILIGVIKLLATAFLVLILSF